MRKQLEKREIEGINVYSRGLAVLFPEPMNQKAALVLKNNDINVDEEQLAVSLEQEDINQSDLILVIKEETKETILETYEDIPDIYTIKELAGEQGIILDPYGKDMIDYEYCFREMERLFEKIVDQLVHEE